MKIRICIATLLLAMSQPVFCETIELSSPDGLTVVTVSDNDRLAGGVKKCKADKKRKVKVSLPCNGGFVITNNNMTAND